MIPFTIFPHKNKEDNFVCPWFVFKMVDGCPANLVSLHLPLVLWNRSAYAWGLVFKISSPIVGLMLNEPCRRDTLIRLKRSCLYVRNSGDFAFLSNISRLSCIHLQQQTGKGAGKPKKSVPPGAWEAAQAPSTRTRQGGEDQPERRPKVPEAYESAAGSRNQRVLASEEERLQDEKRATERSKLVPSFSPTPCIKTLCTVMMPAVAVNLTVRTARQWYGLTNYISHSIFFHPAGQQQLESIKGRAGWLAAAPDIESDKYAQSCRGRTARKTSAKSWPGVAQIPAQSVAFSPHSGARSVKRSEAHFK